MLPLRDYQERSLDALREYLQRARLQDAGKAFAELTERPYYRIPVLCQTHGDAGPPYICLRVPTGGGKTLMACHAIDITAREYIQTERLFCLWLAPSNAIVEQTLKALRDREHPYRQALDLFFSSNVTVMELKEALFVTKADLEGTSCIVVTTLQALRVEDTDGRKVYESAGALQHHFNSVPPQLKLELESEGNGNITYSLANVLRLHRPLVIMDEAHNARTPLSFDTLARFRPSCIIEFTATPERENTPERGKFASNILHQVSALELKEAEMIKLPIKLKENPSWQMIISDAIAFQRELESIATEEMKATGEYIRPIVLFQAQSVNGNDITVEVVKRSLIEDFKIPEEQIRKATGTDKELQGIDLSDSECPIRFIITVRALAEGWDCPFAYILCSVSEISTPRSVEQILGRILRMPQAQRKKREELNHAYAFVASSSLAKTALTLRDALVDGAGFEKLEAEQMFTGFNGTTIPIWDDLPLFNKVSEPVSAPPVLDDLPVGLRSRIVYDHGSCTLTVEGSLTAREVEQISKCFTAQEDKEAVQRLAERSQSHGVSNVSQKKNMIQVPVLAVRIDGQLEIFEETHFLEVPWNLAVCDERLDEAEFPTRLDTSYELMIDVSDKGKVIVSSFAQEVQEQLALITPEPGWTISSLATWIDRRIPHQDIPIHSSSLFIHNVLSHLIDSRQLTVEQLAREKFRLTKSIATRIEHHRIKRHRETYQSLLFGPSPLPIEVSSERCFTFDERHYSPNWYYDGHYRFQKHLFRLIGELKREGEEFECAVFLDQLIEVETWVRNLERRPESSFWLQTSTDRFYPDFVARLIDGRILVVEHKGEQLWSNDDSKEKRAIGELWAMRSNGRCLFAMTKGTDWESIKRVIKESNLVKA